MSDELPTAVNADFDRRVALDTSKLPWIPSPQPGVDRRLLDRVGAEVARATSIVRYAPAGVFPAHEHGAGEEFLVLEGTFSDEHGDYPAGTYVRNPPGSSHAPFTREGCTIFVKLRQMRRRGEPQVVVNASALNWRKVAGNYFRKDLFDGGPGGERVALEQLAPGAALAAYRCDGGEEILVLSGTLEVNGNRYGSGAWLRSPNGHSQTLRSDSGCMFWVKRGHLPP